MSNVTHAELDVKFDKILDKIDTHNSEIVESLKVLDTRIRNLEISFASSEGYRKAQAAVWGIASGLFTSIISGVVIWLLTKG